MKVFFIYFTAILVVAGLGFFLFQASNKPIDPTTQPGQTYENLGAEHITDGSTEHAPYNSNPPTSGPHWPQPAVWGIYKQKQPDERLIHNLEHGGIWISYKPDVSAETITLLEDFAKRYKKVIVEPREENTAPIALAAWTHMQTLDSYDERTIIKFIEAYYDQGPEKVP